MNKRYLILAILAVAVGAGILFMPETDRDKEMKPEQLLIAIDDPSRFLTTDLITDRLVKNDPSLLLIDVRTAEQFKEFSVPGSVNIPLDSLLTTSSIGIMSNKDIDKVFCSNSELTADQAWILAKRQGIETIFVMQGGVNKWFDDIVKVEEPSPTEPSEAIALYRFRKAASQHFFGTPEIKSVVQPLPKKSVTVHKAPAGATSGGGC
ncbi:MAG: hypothetical protein FD166_2442 [Bacteroidetes bacterium]|nr:MAG: hypothetical protein FD166_2442 [Bacteroidota bacterium]